MDELSEVEGDSEIDPLREIEADTEVEDVPVNERLAVELSEMDALALDVIVLEAELVGVIEGVRDMDAVSEVETVEEVDIDAENERDGVLLEEGEGDGHGLQVGSPYSI